MSRNVLDADSAAGGRIIVFLAGAALLTAADAWSPIPAAVLAAGTALLVTAVFVADRHPRAMMSVVILLVLLAGTKFRERNALLATQAVADTQIFFELGLYGLMALVTVQVVMSTKFRWEQYGGVETMLACFALLAVMSAIWSPVRSLTLVRGVQLSVLVLVVSAAVRLLGPARLIDTLHRSLVGYVLASATIALMLPATTAVHVARELDRFSWFHSHPITVATLAGAATVAILSRLLFGPRAARRMTSLASGAAAVATSFIVIATRSRGPLAALCVVLAVLLARRYLRPALAAALMCFVAALFSVSLITGYAPADAARDLASSSDSVSDYLLRGQSEQEILELSGRRELWSGIAPYIGDKPILGHGYLSSRVVLIDLLSWGRRGGYAHNAVIQTLLDFGVVGLLLLWLPLVRALFPGPLLGPVDPELARTRATIFGVTLFLVVNSLSSESFAGAPGFEIFVVIAFAIAADRLATPRRRGRAPTPNYS